MLSYKIPVSALWEWYFKLTIQSVQAIAEIVQL